MEGPLNKKAQDRIDRFTPVWKQAANFMLKMAGVNHDPKKTAPIFDKPETVQPRTTAETRQLNVNAGMPLVTILRDEGKSEEYIEQMLKDKQQEEARKQASLAQSLLNAERQFNSGGNNA